MPQRLGPLAVLVLCLYVLSAGGHVEARPERSPGNSGNAKVCQKGGYLLLKRQDGTGFATTGECVSYAARGGVLIAKLLPPAPTPTLAPASLSEGCAALNDPQYDGEYDAGYGVGPTGLSFTAGEVISIDATALPSTYPMGTVYFLFTGAHFVGQPESDPALVFVVPTTGVADATWYFITDSDPYPVLWEVSCRAGS